MSCLFVISTTKVQAEENYSANDNLSLFGIAIHQEQRNDIYIGALYAPENIKSTDQLVDPSVSKKMSLKFLSKYSERKMARFWKQRIALNNKKSNWQPFTKSILEFGELFKRPMQVGDELSIQFSPSTGTSIFLNGTHFLTIQDISFYKLILNVWIGNIPPTRAFKLGITGKNSSSVTEKLAEQHANLQIEFGRFDGDKPTDVEVAIDAPQEKNKQSTKKSATNSKKKVAKAKIEKKPSEVSPKNQKTKSNNKTADKPKSEASDLPVSADIALTPPVTTVEIIKPELIDIPIGSDNTTQTILQEGQEKSDSSTEIKTAEEKPTEKLQPEATEKKSATKEQIAKLDLPEEKLFDSDLYIGTYTKKLISSIRKVQRYPKKAIDQGIEGDVVVLIKIDKNGEVLDRELTQRSGSRIIDRAVLKMVSKAEPFPVIPDELNLEEFEFSVPLSFYFTN